MATSTLAQVLNAMVDDYGLGRRGDNTGASASQFTDDGDKTGGTGFGGADGAEGIVAGSQILITSGTGAPLGEITSLASKPKLSTGVALLDPALTTALADGDTFLVLKKGLRFIGGGNGLIDKVNQAQTDFQWEKRYVPITSVADGDMLSSGTSDWTAVDGAGGGDVPTLAKVAASFPLGERVLRVTNNATGAGDYARSVNIPVEENQGYYIEALGMIALTGAAADIGTLVLFDVTNAAAITLIETTIDRFEPELLKNTVTIPAGCEQVQIRLTCTAVNDIIDWGHVIFRKIKATRWTIADRPVRPARMGRLLNPDRNTWETRSSWQEVPSRINAVGAGVWEYTTDRTVTGSLWYEEFIAPADMAASTVATASTQIPVRDLAPVAAEKVLRQLQFRSEEWAASYKIAKEDAAGVIQAYWERNQTIVTAPSPPVYRMLRA